MLTEAAALLRELGRRSSRYQAGVLLGLVYWTVVAATALVVRISRRRLIPNSFGSVTSHWIRRDPTPRTLEELARQF